MKLSVYLPLIMVFGAGIFVACNGSEDGVSTCGRDADCSSGYLCFNGSCIESGDEADAGLGNIDGGTQVSCGGDGDCAADEICRDGSCVIEVPECTSEADCREGQRCEAGRCTGEPNDGRCRGDNDCTGDQICVAGVCEDPSTPECRQDTDCAAGERCFNGVCEAEGGGGDCQSEADCPIDSFCNRRDGSCNPLPPGACRDDSVCEGTCDIADGRTIGRCVDCTSDAECPAPRQCISESCRMPEGQCEGDADCPGGGTCNGGQCEGGNGACRGQEDCPAGEFCNPQTGQCVGGDGGGGGLPPGVGVPQCNDNSDCAADQQCLQLAGQSICLPRCDPNDIIRGNLICLLAGGGLCQPDGTCSAP
ncbi:MAG: hypothetical protein VX405_04835 [Myxococcota bacterium]|nr:hypothetical protein [Myxococcota bacterium]